MAIRAMPWRHHGGKKKFTITPLTLSRRQLEKKISKITRKWRFRNFFPSYDTSR
jgi:hypothetical protein